MVSASLRKSITDLTRRRARTAFAVATLALAVASIGFFAIPTLIDRSMQHEVRVRTARRPDRVRCVRWRSAERELAALRGAAQRRRGRAARQRRRAGARRRAARTGARHRRARLRAPDRRRRATRVGHAAGRRRRLVDVQDANTDALRRQGRRRRHPRRGARDGPDVPITGRGAQPRRRRAGAGRRRRRALRARRDRRRSSAGERGYDAALVPAARHRARAARTDDRGGAPLPGRPFPGSRGFTEPAGAARAGRLARQGGHRAVRATSSA